MNFSIWTFHYEIGKSGTLFIVCPEFTRLLTLSKTLAINFTKVVRRLDLSKEKRTTFLEE